MGWSNVESKYQTSVTELENPFSLVTYQTHSGYYENEFSIGFPAGQGFSCHTILNRRCFIGNVKMKNDDGNVVNYEDRVMYSEPNRFDVFPSYNFLELEIGDGDEVTALAGFTDRLFVFKRRTLYIVNVSNATETGWYLEDTVQNMGVYAPYQVADTERGLAWVNEYGLFYFNGEGIQELSKKIDRDIWETDVGYKSIIGFDPIKRKIIVTTDYESDGGYIYSFDTDSITEFTHLTSEITKLTNYITDKYGELLIINDISAASISERDENNLWEGVI